MGRLELTLPDGKAVSAKGERLATLSGGGAVGKWRVMWGLEVRVPGREAMGEHWESGSRLGT